MYTGDAQGIVCVMNLCSFLAMKGSEGSASPLGLGCAVLVRADADVAAVPGQRGAAGGRAAREGAGRFALEAATLRRCPPLKKWRQGHQDPSTSSIVSGVCFRPGIGAILQMFCGPVVFNF